MLFTFNQTQIMTLKTMVAFHLGAQRNHQQARYLGQQEQEVTHFSERNPQVRGKGPVKYAKDPESPPLHVCNCVLCYEGPNKVAQPLTGSTRGNIEFTYPRKVHPADIEPPYISFHSTSLLRDKY